MCSTQRDTLFARKPLFRNLFVHTRTRDHLPTFFCSCIFRSSPFAHWMHSDATIIALQICHVWKLEGFFLAEKVINSECGRTCVLLRYSSPNCYIECRSKWVVSLEMTSSIDIIQPRNDFDCFRKSIVMSYFRTRHASWKRNLCWIEMKVKYSSGRTIGA